jgi:nucleoid-associated protein YgaU
VEGGVLIAAANPPMPVYVIIRRGDSLWRIARRNYGRGIHYRSIFEANRDVIRSPHRIFPGQVFVIPASARGRQTVGN